MSHTRNAKPLVLSIYPSSAGLGYAVFEGASTLIDWGEKRYKHNRNEQCLLAAASYLNLYRPAVLILENYKGAGSRRTSRIETLISSLAVLGTEQGVPVRLYSRAAIRETFAESGRKKHVIARAIAARFPELEPSLPPRRKLWTSEDRRMAIFDAVALALTHFARSEQES